MSGQASATGVSRRSCSFREVTVELAEGQSFYMTTDGLLEQVGGMRHRCFGRKRFTEAIAEGQGRSMGDQRKTLLATLASHQGQEARRDDVTVLGFVPLGA